MNSAAKIVIIIAVVVATFYLIYTRFSVPKLMEEPIKIGAILPLSGSNALFGEWIKNGMELALEDVNSKNIKIVYEDSQFDAKQGVSAFNKLVDTDNADIIVAAMSSVSVPLIPLAKEKNKILMLQDVTYPNITKESPLVFRHFIQSDREAETISSYAFSELGVKMAGILYVNDEAGVGAKESFIKTFEERGGKIFIIESFSGKDTDMRTQILKIKSTNPDAIYLFGNGPSWAKALVQIKESGFEGKILTNTAMFIKNFRDAAGDTTENVYFTYPYSDENNANVKNFIAKYKSKYNSETAIESYYAWDLIHILSDALKNNGWKVNGLEKSILGIKEFEGLFGKTIINQDGDFITYIGIGVIENNNIKTLKIVNP